METGYPIALTLGTQKGDVRVHLGTKFGWTTVNTRSYLQFFTKNNTNMLSQPQGKPRMARK